MIGAPRRKKAMSHWLGDIGTELTAAAKQPMTTTFINKMGSLDITDAP
jgi:hypothetical protein